MKKKKEFKCDMCGKSYSSAKGMKRMILPSRFYKMTPRDDYDGTDKIVTLSVFACRKCLNRTLELLETEMNVGFYDFNGEEVSWKQ